MNQETQARVAKLMSNFAGRKIVRILGRETTLVYVEHDGVDGTVFNVLTIDGGRYNLDAKTGRITVIR